MKGTRFTANLHEKHTPVFEIIDIKCEVKRENGEIFFLSLNMFDYLCRENLVQIHKPKEETR